MRQLLAGDRDSAGAQRSRFCAAERRKHLLQAAAGQFAATGVNGTTTAALAKAADISEPVLYLHFESKEALFREVVERNVEARLRMLQSSLAANVPGGAVAFIEYMARATVSVCIGGVANAALMNWALMEAPQYAVDLHRREVGSIEAMWGRELEKQVFDAHSRRVILMRLLPYAVHACLACGFWLSALRHNAETGAALAREFAAGVARAASALLAGRMPSPGPPA